MEQVAQLVGHARGELSKAVVGQQAVLDQLLCVILAGGHALVEGAPGVAKTLAVKTLARIFRLEFQRVQCTSDLMPADMLGTNVMNLTTGAFALHRGPIFTDLLLVDEINRTPPRTQAALLEAMEEHQATIDGVRYPLSQFFTVLATQNPIEFEGTYPLPEAQLDRFLMKVRISYPEADQETQILKAHHEGFVPRDLDALNLVPVEAAALAEARRAVQGVGVEASLLQYITAVARRTREWPSVSLGASPRAAVALLLVAKALAAMDGRDYLIPDDVKSAAPGVLRHRLVLQPEADLEGLTPEQVIADLLAAVPVPK
jgi:MoxR-like ATPase